MYVLHDTRNSLHLEAFQPMIVILRIVADI